ncbi:hypothetical protein QAD02_020805 [Eretmocerus hayati]|uniref:Uncharacterized protein n=1 Tax=Eretmocerus hayati TaxID=131215 RepID=A0ACC2PNM0_9HYME|nr:hypothetical protein QAD02_020805 [Eretmocerus hayati]
MTKDTALLTKQVALRLGRISTEDYMLFCINQRRFQHFPGTIQKRHFNNGSPYQCNAYIHLLIALLDYNAPGRGEVPTAAEIEAEALFAQELQGAARSFSEERLSRFVFQIIT